MAVFRNDQRVFDEARVPAFLFFHFRTVVRRESRKSIYNTRVHVRIKTSRVAPSVDMQSTAHRTCHGCIAGTHGLEPHVSCSARVAHRLPCAEAHERLPDERLLVCLCQLVLPQRESTLRKEGVARVHSQCGVRVQGA